MRQNRDIALDLLRLFALGAVIGVHCAGMGTAAIPMGERRFLTFVTSILTWQVPVFVMISGRFFLDPQRNVDGKRLKKAILRLVIAFLVWNCVYQAYYVLSGAYTGLNWRGILTQAIIGPYHFWFLFMMVCLYAITPFLRKIAEDKRLTLYFIGLFLAFEALEYYGTALPALGGVVSEVLGKANFHFALGFAGYYLMGWYLHRWGIPKRLELPLYLLAVMLAVGAGVLTVRRSVLEGVNAEWYTKYLMPNVAVEAAAVFTFFRRRVETIRIPDKAARCIARLSEYSFGIYLVHALAAELLGAAGVSVAVLPALMLPAAVALVFALSAVCVAILRKIPVFGKKIT